MDGENLCDEDFRRNANVHGGGDAEGGGGQDGAGDEVRSPCRNSGAEAPSFFESNVAVETATHKPFGRCLLREGQIEVWLEKTRAFNNKRVRDPSLSQTVQSKRD